jgi:uncharacterized YigZ family protein
MSVPIIDSYLTIDAPSIGEYKDRGSKFIGYAYPFDEESVLNIHLENLNMAHNKAVHFCYAYKIGVDGTRFRTNDDGEPSGSAGKPILGQIVSAGLTNVLVIVVRYFGGTKLGVPGLIEAYKGTTKLALFNTIYIEKYVSRTYTISFGYEQMGEIMNAIKDTDLTIISKSFDSKCVVKTDIRLSQEISLIHKLKAKIMGRSMDEIGPDFEIPFCDIDCGE